MVVAYDCIFMFMFVCVPKKVRQGDTHQLGTGGSFPGVKQPGRGADHASAKVK